jgi:glycosyltransferase 2 family protein
MNQTVKMLLLTLGLSALGLLLLRLTGQTFNLNDFGALVKLDPLYLVLVPVSLVAWWLMAGWRIQLLANSPAVTLSRSTRALLLSLYGAAVTPGSTGANVALAWYLSRYVDSRRATATAIFTLSLDLVYFAWSLPVWFIILQLKGIDLHLAVIGPILGVVVGLFALFAGGLAWSLSYQTKRLEGIAWWITGLRFLKRFRRGALRFIRETADAMLEIRGLPPQRQFLLHLSTTLGFLLHFAVANMVAAGLGLPVDHVDLLAMQSIIIALSFVVPTPGGAGFFEVALGSSVRSAGIPDAAVAPFLVIWRVLSYYLYVFIGPFIGGPAMLRAASSSKPETPAAPSSRANL